jgi:site-specific DNA-cytosine methylase
MPYIIKKVNDGFKVCKRDEPDICFSKKGIPKSRAIKQMKAIGINEGKGRPGRDFSDKENQKKGQRPFFSEQNLEINTSDNNLKNDILKKKNSIKLSSDKSTSRKLKGGLKMFELFKGTGSVGKVATKNGFDVVSLDFDPIYTPDIETDILKWDYKKWASNNNFYPSYIWASPPCNTFSPLAYPLKERDTKTAKPFSERAKIGTKILYKTLEIIKYFISKNPKMLFTIENPRGMMRKDLKMLKLPNRETTLYCLYGDFKKKPTDFWSNFEMNLNENKQCKNKTIPVVDLPNIEQRYSIPSKLIKKILEKAKKILSENNEGGAKPKDIKLYESIKEKVYEEQPKHSLYRSARIAKEYKKAGGEYTNDDKPKMNINKWFNQKWISLNDSLRGDSIPPRNSYTQKKYDEYPLCRPLAIAELLTKTQMKKMIKEKNKLEEKQLITKKVLDNDKFNIKSTLSGTGAGFFKQLDKIGYNPELYLKDARNISKKRGYNPKLLNYSEKPNKKLNYNGVDFGQVNYNDFLIYKFLERKGDLPKDTANKKMRNYRARATKIKGDWALSKESPNSLAINILW